MAYKIVLFDADGTLLDFKRSESEAVRQTMEDFDIEPTDEKVSLYSEINDGLWKALERREITKDVLKYRRFEIFCDSQNISRDAKAMAKKYTEHLSTKGYLLDGAEVLCQKLYGKVKMYIVTNGIDFVQKGRFAVSPILKYFDGLFISDSIGYEKPDLKYFDYVAQHITDFNKNECLMVGDSLTSDIKGGISFGIDTCWYNPNQKNKPEDMNITYVSYNFDEIYGIITGERERSE